MNRQLDEHLPAARADEAEVFKICEPQQARGCIQALYDVSTADQAKVPRKTTIRTEDW